MNTDLPLSLLTHEMMRVSGADWVLLFAKGKWANVRTTEFAMVDTGANFGLVLDLGDHDWWGRLSIDDVSPVLKHLYVFAATITPVLPSLGVWK